MFPNPNNSNLYDPSFEHDACGVGMICRIDGTPEHDVVRRCLTILDRLEHRGAVGSDPETGDGAGIMMQIPHAFLKSEMRRQGVELSEPGQYAVAMLFAAQSQQSTIRKGFEDACQKVGMDVLGWRAVPVRSEAVGATARLREPSLWQCFIERPTSCWSDLAFERLLFVARRMAEKAAGPTKLHVASCSSRTLVYKGMLTVGQVKAYFPDLSDPRLASAVAVVHSRFSTNTFPRWPLAHPFRYLCHNGEINTLRGNANWMRAREAMFETEAFGPWLDEIRPILQPGMSDSQALDAALELLVLSGRSLPHAIMMLIPEAWERHESMGDDRRAFYEYASCLMEPWDGPATVLFTDGRFAGATLDRNGLRPSRYTVTHDGYLILGSEAGTLRTPADNVLELGRLQPGRMLLVDLAEGRIVEDEEIKSTITRARPYERWVRENMRHVDALPLPQAPEQARQPIDREQVQFGYTRESLEEVIRPMAEAGKESIGSMGRDVPLAVLSDQARPVFDYFKQLFAQVTNPPLDAIRERLVTSLYTNLGGCRNFFEETPNHADVIRLDRPFLSQDQLLRLQAGRPCTYISMLVEPYATGDVLELALDRIALEAENAVRNGARLLVLSDRGAGPSAMPMPSLLALGAVHQHLLREGLRLECSIVVDSGEPREVHHVCALIGFGASAVRPYLLIESAQKLAREGKLEATAEHEVEERVLTALSEGLLKVMSKMGISAVHSYRGAQIFEAVGVGSDIIERCFAGTASRIGGVGYGEIAEDYARLHSAAYDRRLRVKSLPEGGLLRWRRTGEQHALRPMVVSHLQQSVRTGALDEYEKYAALINDQSGKLLTLRGLLRLREETAEPIPIEEVEPWTSIVQRFKTGAMSYGSISREAHETLAVAMNRIGGKSNTGEGGEDPDRYDRNHPGRSRIKQVASGRFGVTSAYLASADEIQIKMAQGAKPGEGGQLPGKKVYPWIARTRHSTPWVGLISPPPHHDIYSIEDLAQLIFDLRNASPQARISVKLVSETGVGTVAAGVTKAKADVVLISGHDGGTGASPVTSIYHAGLPWELGLAETHQTLTKNGLRSRIRVECDGQLKTGRDVAIAAMLGADEFGFATMPLIAMGCVMMRKCHLNTCPVGIATQDPKLRALFSGQPEHVLNYFHFVAEELRGIMAALGIRTIAELTGRSDLLEMRSDIAQPKAQTLDLSRLLAPATADPSVAAFDEPVEHSDLAAALDLSLIEEASAALESGESVEIRRAVNNENRTIGTLLSHAISRRYGADGLPADTIKLALEGTAGQSFMAFGAAGIRAKLIGSANDYCGKGLSGAHVIVRPPQHAAFRPHEQIIVGNVALYGATSGALYVRGRAGERFAVRNSGALAVVEGVGDHGCEYMTGGTVVILGPTGRNFAAGMSGGVSYVLDGTLDFRSGRCDPAMVDLEPVTAEDDQESLRRIVSDHLEYTGSSVAAWVLSHWDEALQEFVKVMPREYRAALERMENERANHVAA